MSSSAARYNRKQRLLRDSFAAAVADINGARAAMVRGYYYDIPLNGLSTGGGLGGAFRAARNLLDPPRLFEDFSPEEIAAHPGFAAYRDALNDNGMDIDTTHGHYELFVVNKSITRGVRTPLLRVTIVPWDGAKKPLEPFDIYKHMPRRPPRPIFY